MLIEEIINEKEFGLMSRGKAAVANFGRSALGKMGSTKMHNKALKGKVQQDAMRGANKVSDAFTTWLARKYPDQDPNFLNTEHLKDFMQTSQLLKGQEKAGFPVFKGQPSIQKMFKDENPVQLDPNIKKEIFLQIAMLSGLPDSGGTAGGQPQVKGATSDPADLQQIQKALDGMSDAQKAAVINMASQQLKSQ